MVKNACKDASIPFGRNVENGFTFHDLRHSFATHADDARLRPNVIMAIMGHTGTNNMNQRYTKVTDDALRVERDLFEAYLGSVTQVLPIERIDKEKEAENIEEI